MAKTVEEMISVMEAYKNGKKIKQFTKMDKKWHEVIYPAWNWGESDYDVMEEKYRPYKDTEEMIEDFSKRFSVDLGKEIVYSNLALPTIWIKNKTSNNKYLVYRVSDVKIEISISILDMKSLLEDYTYLDGSPCGVKE